MEERKREMDVNVTQLAQEPGWRNFAVFYVS